MLGVSLANFQVFVCKFIFVIFVIMILMMGDDDDDNDDNENGGIGRVFCHYVKQISLLAFSYV